MQIKKDMIGFRKTMFALYEFLISKYLMGLLLLMLAISMGVATFIENDYGTNAAKSLIYNSWWFELIFLILGINLLGNLSKHKMWRMQHLAVTMFHASFFIIVLGAGVTRYFGYEGYMHIREGSESNTIISSDSYLQVQIDDKSQVRRVFFSPVSPNQVDFKFDNGVKVQSISYIPNASLTAVESNEGEPMLFLVEINGRKQEEKLFALGDTLNLSDVSFGFEVKDSTRLDVILKRGVDKILFTSKVPIVATQMQSGITDSLTPNKEYHLELGMIYQFGSARVVLNKFINNAVVQPQYRPSVVGLPDAVILKISKDNHEKQFVVMGRSGQVGELFSANIDGVEMKASYGSIPIKIPFKIHLNDFVLERYPGSNSPSSYASFVTLLDQKNKINEDRKIYMNNILNYKGYRFYQSSYDSDELGTVLSVNHDWLGTILTYIGYFLMTLGMLLALILSNTRFRYLIHKTIDISKRKKELIVVLFMILAMGINAQDVNPPHKIPKDVAHKFGELWVQDNSGRIEPLNTLNSEISRKLVKHNSFHGLSADQLILSMMVDHSYWQNFPTITVKNEELRKWLNVTGKKTSFRSFFTSEGSYIIGKQVEDAYRKKSSEQSKMEQELIKIDEQVNVFYLTQVGRFFKLFPNPGNINEEWISVDQPVSVGLANNDSLFIRNAFSKLLNAVTSNQVDSGKYYLSQILEYQEVHASSILPSKTHKAIEIFYNEVNIFLMLMPILMILGLLLLVVQFITLLYPRWTMKWPNKIGLLLLIGLLGAYSLGMALRWYISGHAPWSNGYESMLYIGWTTQLAGLIFAKRSPIAASVSALFTSIILLVAHLSWMNPEITNLVPVLKSYWLTIHVAVIVASYGFLGLSALLGFINLLVTALKTSKNKEYLTLTVEELSSISELSMTVGLYLLTIGSFLGGIWANESWGRYWGWDPKETWSMVTIIVYAFILHMRLIPGMKSKLTYNIWAVVGFGAVIMTYLGVNYYLAGMHSYAKGDTVPVPVFVYYVIVILAVVSIFAIYNDKKLKKG